MPILLKKRAISNVSTKSYLAGALLKREALRLAEKDGEAGALQKRKERFVV